MSPLKFEEPSFFSNDVTEPPIFKGRRLSIPDMLNSDEENSDIDSIFSTTPTSTSTFGSVITADQSDSDLEQDWMASEYETDADGTKIPIWIDIKTFPLLKVSKRHHHMIKTASLRRPLALRSKGFQGRPFTNSFKIQFFVHRGLQNLIATLMNNTDYRTVTFPTVNSIQDAEMLIMGLGGRCDSKESFAYVLQSVFQSDAACLIQDIKKSGSKLSFAQRKTIVYEPVSQQGGELHKALQSFLTPICLARQMHHSFTFVAIWRNSGGKFIKLETVDPPPGYDATWLKSKICLPRYKCGMKLHVFLNKGFERPTVVYHDLRILYWDLKNRDVSYFKEREVIIIS